MIVKFKVEEYTFDRWKVAFSREQQYQHPDLKYLGILSHRSI
jgi:hypothetical protein